MAKSNRFDVAIIGAGAAGLYAALQLVNEGLRVIVLEGRDRIGGRVHTVMAPGIDVPIELGAEFVHEKPRITSALLKKARLMIYDAEGSHRERFKRGIRIANLWEEIAQVLERMHKAARDISFKAFLEEECADIDSRTKEKATEFIEGFNAASADEISVLALAREMSAENDSPPDRRIGAGYGVLFEEMRREIQAKGGIIQLNSQVTDVLWQRAGVGLVVLSKNETVEVHSRAVITTIPAPLLADPDFVRFDPEIVKHRKAANEVGHGKVIKVIVRFDKAWWLDYEELKGLSFIHASGDSFPTWWTLWPTSAPVLVGWAGGPHGEALSRMSDEEIRGEAKKSLSRVFEFETVGNIVDVIVVNWQRDMFSGGAYSFQKAGCPGAREALADSISDTLFFAGDATESHGLSGTVESALLSGERVARQVIAALGTPFDCGHDFNHNSGAI